MEGAIQMRIMLKSKISGLKVTDAIIDYEGSITIPEKLLKEVDILQYEQVHVCNKSNGNRFITYAISGSSDGECIVNGAAAKLVEIGDELIILAYNIDKPIEHVSCGFYHEAPKIVRVNK